MVPLEESQPHMQGRVPQQSNPRAGHPDVLLAAHSLQPGLGGIARVTRLIASVLAEEALADGRQARALTLADTALPPGVDLPVTLSHNSRLRFVANVLMSWRWCRHYIFDAAHLAQVGALPLLWHKPLMTFIYGIEVWENAKAAYVRSARRATMNIAISEFTRRKAEELYGGFSRARLCWLATESDEAPPPRAPGNGPPEVLIVGRMLPDRPKGHRHLIDSWARVSEAVPGAVLRIVGHGPDLDALRQLAARSPAAEQIVMEGFVPDAEVEKRYAQATVFAMPSRGEGFGLVYIEAMRHGLPVVASCHDAAPEVVLDGQTGYTVDLDRPGELAERLIHLLRDPDGARRMGEAGRQRWAEHFRFSSFRQRFRPLFREFLDS
jgi:phosphatidylinositol alpha-1,6-mannosyltransferase